MCARCAAAPANDLLAQRSPLSGPSGNVVGTVVGASVQPLETALLVNAFGITDVTWWHPPTRTVWYSWTAAAAGTLLLRTTLADSDSAANTVIAVFDAATVGASGDVSRLLAVAASRAGNASRPGVTDEIAARVRAGGVYAIVVADPGSDYLLDASFRLTWAFGGQSWCG
jgi:hypothetical protein